MIIIFLLIIKLIVIGVLSIISIVFLGICLAKWKNQRNYKVPLSLFIVFGLLSLMVFNTDLTSAESTDREDSVPAFQSNFGFEPPQTVEEIKLKNFALYDASVHWMSFTYDSSVFEAIIIHDQPLLIARPNSNEHSDIMMQFSDKNPNAPDWFVVPSSNSTTIYYKKDFLNHSFSEYYLWHTDDMVYLMVHYFD